MIRRILVLTGLVILVTATAGYAQSTQIAGGPHDFSAGSALRNSDTAINGQTCVFCHTPHGGGVSAPLWNRNAPTSTYTVYTSTSSDVTTTAASIQSSASGSCLSCHDGSIGIDVLINSPLTTGTGVTFTKQATARGTYGNQAPGTLNLMTGGVTMLGSDLRNDHPINVIYETARAVTPTEFVTQAITGSKVTVGAAGPLPLYGTATATATIECASCHNPHNNQFTNFLRKSNASSAICLTCHVK